MKTCVPVTDTCTYKPYNALFAVVESAILSFLMRPSPLSGRIQDGDWVQIPVRKKLAAKDRNLHPVAILNSAARTTRWTGTASEKNAQFRRAKFEKQS